jgi:branched-chain amino acid transport system substrate-binding protein
LFIDAYKLPPDVYAVQGWDTMQLLDIGLKAVGGDVSKRAQLNAAMAKATIASPRGPLRFSSSHNPIQNFYLRELRGGVNNYLGIVEKELSDDTTGCKLA